MATLHYLKIKNFRGIKDFEQIFNKGLTCIIGRGDSGKTTILDAISFVLSSNWNISLCDSDFYNCITENPIEIEVTLTDIPDKLVVKYFLYLRGVLEDGSIIDDMELAEAQANVKTALTIKFTVSKDLEPSWNIVTDRGQEPIQISAADRSRLNLFYISEYTDRHFSLNKGNPLYSLFKQLNDGDDDEDKNSTILDVLREAKEKIDESISAKFELVINTIIETSSTLGINANDINVEIDYRDISIKDNKVCLHENKIPLRLKGKGSKRLLSLIIQLSLVSSNGIILIDEIEQGLEPDRVQHLVSILKNYTEFQIFFTTHSRDVVVELPCNNIFLMTKDRSKLQSIPNNLQGCIRKNPEALFAKRIIVCEGATEVGICRSFNNYRQSIGETNLSCLGIRLADGGGDSMIGYASDFKSIGYDVCLLCDSDVDKINKEKETLLAKEIAIYDCEEGNSIEKQLFNDLPRGTIRKMLEYSISLDGLESKSIFDSVNSKLSSKLQFTENWYETDNDEIRKALGIVFQKNGWYKRIDHGEAIGDIIFSNWSEVDKSKRTQTIFFELSKWINN
jgi:putative ATP-dependent endonuclease of OLD family